MAIVCPTGGHHTTEVSSGSADTVLAMDVTDHESALAAAPDTERWTPAMVETLAALGAVHGIDTDQGVSYPMWDWDYPGPGYRLHVLGVRAPNDGRWMYVVELSHDEGDNPFGLLIKPTQTLHDRDAMFACVADLLNYARGLTLMT